MPLATELTSLIISGKRLKGLGPMQKWLADFKQRLATAEGVEEDASRFPLNVEQVFDFAKYEEELWRMKQQLSSVGREYGDTPWGTANSITAWLSYLEEELSHVIWDAQERADVKLIRRFTDQLSGEDTILTFNYDTLVETALSEREQTWNHGLKDRDKGGVTVLKMHGSVDWLLLERRPEGQLEKFVKLFSKTDKNVYAHGAVAPQEEEYALELWRAKDKNTCKGVIDMDKSGLSSFRYKLGLAGLGQYKPLHKLPGSAQTWFSAFDALGSADEIYVIGFSMSPHDNMTRFHFASVIHARPTPPSKVVIVDPNALQLADANFAVFGRNLTLIRSKAEDVDWRMMLGS